MPRVCGLASRTDHGSRQPAPCINSHNLPLSAHRRGQTGQAATRCIRSTPMTAVGQPWKMPGTQSVGRTLQAEGGPLAARFGHCYSFTHESLPLPWQAGQLPVYAEHIFSGILHRVALQSVKDLTRVKISAPRVLLASPSAETHTLALVLMDAMLREAAIPAIWIQGSLPSAQIAQAAASFKVQVVALSASIAYPPKLLASELRTLRELLDASVQLWVGGAGTNRMSAQIDGITVMTSIDQAVRSLKKQGQTKPMRRSASQRNVP